MVYKYTKIHRRICMRILSFYVLYLHIFFDIFAYKFCSGIKQQTKVGLQNAAESVSCFKRTLRNYLVST
jgi:hypothetical protein